MSDPKLPRSAPQAGAHPVMEEMRARLEADEASGKLAGITVERLQRAISHPKAQAVIDEIRGANR